MEISVILALVLELLASWQVIAIAAVVLIYWFILDAVTNRRPGSASKAKKEKAPKVKRLKEPAPALGKNVDDSGLDLGE